MTFSLVIPFHFIPDSFRFRSDSFRFRFISFQIRSSSVHGQITSPLNQREGGNVKGFLMLSNVFYFLRVLRDLCG